MRLGGGDRTKEIPIAEWERFYPKEAQARILRYQARVLAGAKKKDIITPISLPDREKSKCPNPAGAQGRTELGDP